MKIYTQILFILLFILCSYSIGFGQCPDSVFSTLWNIDRVDSVSGYQTTKYSNPFVITTEQGNSVWFDGIDDGLIVKGNPLEGADSAFTAELIFRPDSSDNPDNEAQRYIHIQNPNNDNRRILFELRMNTNQQWYLSTFIKSELNSFTLRLETALHPLGQWYHAALVYDRGIMKNYVDGVEEVSGNVDFLPISNAQTSIGTRMNLRSWFIGAIQTLKVTHCALTPDEFMIPATDVSIEELHLSTFQLMPNFPNPFNSSTMISYKLPGSGYLNASVYDVRGRQVDELYDGYHAAGDYQMYWKGIDAKGESLASGVYILRVMTQQHKATQKMMIVR